MLKPGLKLEDLNDKVLQKLKQYGITEDDIRLEMHKHRTSVNVGVPYRLLIINKQMSTEKQAYCEMDLKALDSSLCVIFKSKK